MDKWSLNNTPIFSCAASNVCTAVLKWEAYHLLWGVCTLWCVKTATTIIWWFIVILPVWASALFSDLYFQAPCGSFLLSILFLRFVTAAKELSNSLICFWKVNQEALTTVKDLDVQSTWTDTAICVPSQSFSKINLACVFLCTGKSVCLIYHSGKHNLHMWHTGLNEG